MDRKTLAKLVIGKTLQWEGGYVNDPDDAGGETNFGITWPTLKEAIRMGIVSPSVTIKGLTVNDAIKIYEALFWSRKLKLDVAWCPDAMATVLFDASVNSGVSRGSKFLQSALKMVPDSISDSLSDRQLAMLNAVAVDGEIGPITRRACYAVAPGYVVSSRYSSYDGLPFDILMATLFTAKRNEFYNTISKNGNNAKFLVGWLRRSEDVRRFAIQMYNKES